MSGNNLSFLFDARLLSRQPATVTLQLLPDSASKRPAGVYPTPKPLRCRSVPSRSKSEASPCNISDDFVRISHCPLVRRDHVGTNLPWHQHLQQSYDRNLVFSTTCHGGHVGFFKNPNFTRSDVLCDNLSQQMSQEATFHDNLQNGLSKSYSMPVLPREKMTNFVELWIEHGSKLDRNNHLLAVDF
ncbi:uncharacterized protein LOC131940562 [Physella acuta]|uniref:uncharacterized protein LOC131940562 n=1 Tax=Physella acuta TaxID=109671 RepID=UPI0027DDECC3|nr:uncharacterized protein LOC131940562 [Physella acuta]